MDPTSVPSEHPTYICPVFNCDVTFGRFYEIARHVTEVHEGRKFCPQPGCKYRGAKRVSKVRKHMAKNHPSLNDGGLPHRLIAKAEPDRRVEPLNLPRDFEFPPHPLIFMPPQHDEIPIQEATQTHLCHSQSPTIMTNYMPLGHATPYLYATAHTSLQDEQQALSLLGPNDPASNRTQDLPPQSNVQEAYAASSDRNEQHDSNVGSQHGIQGSNEGRSWLGIANESSYTSQTAATTSTNDSTPSHAWN